MATRSIAAGEKPNILVRAREFFLEVRNEMRKVAWPSWEELKQQTQIVLLMLAIVAAIIAVYDMVFRFVVVEFLALFA
jgi:preprotein translocase subunit SecE